MKETNTFRFVNFSDRVSSLHVDLKSRYVARAHDSPSDVETLFVEELRTWSNLDSSELFDKFRAKVPRECDLQTLHQLLHHKTDIIESLIEHLQQTDSTPKQSFLELTVALARDLQSDFYEYFWRFFDVFVQLLKSTQDVEILEQIFCALSRLFKLLWRKMVAEINNSFVMFLPLFTARQSYIRRFACEAIAFLVRKLEHFDSFVHLCVVEATKVTALTDTFGLLFAEIIKGVRKQLHSNAEFCLDSILRCLCQSKSIEQFNVLEKIIIKMVQSLSSFCSADQVGVMLQIIMNPKSMSDIDVQLKFKYLTFVVACVDTLLKYKNGILINHHNLVLEHLINYLTSDIMLDETTTASVLSIVSDVIVCKQSQLDLLMVQSVVEKVLSSDCCCKYESSIFDLMIRISNIDCFDSVFVYLILPWLNKRCNDDAAFNGYLIILQRLFSVKCHQVYSDEFVLHRISELEASCFRYPIVTAAPRDKTCNVRLQLERAMKVECSLVEQSQVDDLNLSPLINLLMVAPSFTPLSTGAGTVEGKLQNCFNILLGRLVDGTTMRDSLSVSCEPLLHCLYLLMTFIYSDDFSVFVDDIKSDTIILLCKIHPISPYSLSIAETFFSASNASLNEDVKIDLVDQLSLNLTSPVSKIRLLTLRFFTCFEYKIVTDGNDRRSIFEIALQSEQTECNLSQYRERLRLLSMLSFPHLKNHLPSIVGQVKSMCFEKASLFYLIGNLHVNFTPLWGPIYDMIATFAHNMNGKQFWLLFQPLLELVTERCQNDSTTDVVSVLTKADNSKCDIEICLNFRLRLWCAMLEFADICELNHRMVTPFFIDLVELEYKSVDLNIAPFEDLTTVGDTSAKEGVFPVSAKKRIVSKTVLMAMSVLSKFKNPQAMYKEPKMINLFEEFLQSPYIEMQIAAFHCLYAYKFKWLTPYRQNFDNLCDSKKFRDELILFGIDEESTQIIAEHREHVLLVLMRFLFGRLTSKHGLNDAQSEMRRKAIIRFLAGCRCDEISFFVSLMFKPLQSIKLSILGDVPLDDQCKSVVASYDVTKSIPLNKLHGVMQGIEMVINYLGHRMENGASLLFNALLQSCLAVSCLFNQRSLIMTSRVSSLRHLRLLLLKRITNFFEQFDAYAFTPPELGVLFDTMIFPHLQKMTTEGVYAPTGLVHLFHAWSKSPRCFKLFALTDSNTGWSPMMSLIKLLTNANCTAQVTDVIVDIIHNLFTVQSELDDDQEEKTLFIDLAGLSSYLDGCQIIDVEQIGFMLLKPFANDLFSFLKDGIFVMKGTKRKKRTIDERRLTIVQRLCEFVQNNSDASTLFSILLHVLISNDTIKEEVQLISCLEILDKLLLVVQQFDVNIEQIAKLFYVIRPRIARSVLSNIVEKIAKMIPDLATTTTLIIQLNSFNPKRIDEPFYDRRLDAYSILNSNFNNSSLFMDYRSALLYLYNFAFAIQFVDDISLRDSASYSLQLLIKRVCIDKMYFDDLHREKFICTNVFGLIKKGLKCDKEIVRHEFIHCLRSIIDHFSHETKFTSLKKLVSNDPDEDILLNLTHMQLNRRARALHRISEMIRTNDCPFTADIMLCIFMPISRHYVLNPDYAKYTSLIDEGVGVIASICSVLPWKHYQPVLRLHLTLLTKEIKQQKLFVKLVAAILDAFHFDLFDFVPLNNSNNAVAITENKLEHQNHDIADGEKKVKIYHSIIKTYLPLLHKVLSQKKYNDTMHKLSQQSGYSAEEDIVRVPIALALIKLLQKLPVKVLEKNLPSILLKLFQMLRSRLESLRELTRRTLIDIMQCIGPRYLPYMVVEMRSVMTKGYQVHVMVYTVHSVLNSLRNLLKSGDLDPILKDLLEICNDDLFGQVSEEKDVDAIRKNLKEARHNKVGETFRIMGQLASCDTLTMVIDSMKETLVTKLSHTTVKNVSNVLKLFAQGLSENTWMTNQTLLVFLHSLFEQYMPLLKNVARHSDASTINEDSNLPKSSRRPKSSLLLPDDPKGSHFAPKSNKKSSLYTLVEFAFQALLNVFKKSSSYPEEFCSLVDPFVTFCVEALDPKYSKVTTASLRVLVHLLKINDLPTIISCITKLKQSLFLLLHQFAGLGAASKGENFELVSCLFKTVCALVKCDKNEFNEKQLMVLVQYIEQDISDTTRQATAFSLLRSMLYRGFQCSELDELMLSIREMMVRSSALHVRDQCKSAYLQYLLEYPLKNKLKLHIEFILTQLNYEFVDGRICILQLLNSLLAHLPQEKLHDYSTLILVYLALGLSNDESNECKKLVTNTLHTLIRRVNLKNRDEMFNLMIEWFTFTPDNLQRPILASQLIAIFAVVEEEDNFKKRFTQVMPKILTILSNALDNSVVEHERSKICKIDMLLTQVITCVATCFTHCTDLMHLTSKQTTEFWEYSFNLLLYPHEWVQLTTSKLLTFYFLQFQHQQIALCLTETTTTTTFSSNLKNSFILVNLPEKFVRLVDAFWLHLLNNNGREEFIDQAIKNLVFLGKCLTEVPTESNVNFPQSVRIADSAKALPQFLNLTWFFSKFIRIVRNELIKTPTIFTKRNAVFKVIAAVLINAKEEVVKCVLPVILPSIYREMMVGENETLKQFALEVADCLKGTVNIEFYMEQLSKCQKSLNTKREVRKRKAAEEFVVNPKEAVKRKIRKNVAKRRVKDKRLVAENPYKFAKKKLKLMAKTN